LGCADHPLPGTRGEALAASQEPLDRGLGVDGEDVDGKSGEGAVQLLDQGLVRNLFGHLYLAVADQQGRTVGGHLAEGCTVRTTAQVILAADDRLLFAREHDSATGYDELVVREHDP
jgi:Plants and Prokaryotes Conserved (PCC) domain